MSSGTSQLARPSLAARWLVAACVLSAVACSRKPAPPANASDQAASKGVASATESTPLPSTPPKLRLATDLPAGELAAALSAYERAEGVDVELVRFTPEVRGVDGYLMQRPEALAGRRFVAPSDQDLVAPWAKAKRWAVVAVAARVLVTRPEAPTDELRADGLRHLVEPDAAKVGWCPRCEGTVRHLGVLSRRWGKAQLSGWLGALRGRALAFPTEAAVLAALEQGRVEIAWVDYAGVPATTQVSSVVLSESAEAGVNVLWPVVLAVAAGSPRGGDLNGLLQFLLRSPEAQASWGRQRLLTTADDASRPAPFTELGQRGLLASDPVADWGAGRAAGRVP